MSRLKERLKKLKEKREGEKADRELESRARESQREASGEAAWERKRQHYQKRERGLQEEERRIERQDIRAAGKLPSQKIGRFVKKQWKEAGERREATHAEIRKGQLQGLREGTRLKTIRQQTGATKVRVGKKGRIGVEYAPQPPRYAPQRQYGTPVRSYTRYAPQAGRYIKVGRYSRQQIPRIEEQLQQQPKDMMDIGLDLGLGSINQPQSQQPQRKKRAISDLGDITKGMFGL